MHQKLQLQNKTVKKQVTITIGKTMSFIFIPILPPLQIKYCFRKNLSNVSRFFFTEIQKEIKFCAIYIELTLKN